MTGVHTVKHLSETILQTLFS